jgi:hypothetical protein
MEIQSLQCPMLVVTGRKSKPEAEIVLIQALRRAVNNLNTRVGPRGLSGLAMASKEIPILLRKDEPSVKNSLGEWAFFTFRVSEQNRKDIAKFLLHAGDELNLEKLKEASSSMLGASERYGSL